MEKAHPVSSPMVYSSKLSKFGYATFFDPTLYTSVVSALQYANLTRPDICLLSTKFVNLWLIC